MAKRGVRKNGLGGRGVGKYALTPRRRMSILKAQRVSAHRRKFARSKDTVGYWVAKGAKTAANKVTFGAAGTISGAPDHQGQYWFRRR